MNRLSYRWRITAWFPYFFTSLRLSLLRLPPLSLRGWLHSELSGPHGGHRSNTSACPPCCPAAPTLLVCILVLYMTDVDYRERKRRHDSLHMHYAAATTDWLLAMVIFLSPLVCVCVCTSKDSSSNWVFGSKSCNHLPHFSNFQGKETRNETRRQSEVARCCCGIEKSRCVRKKYHQSSTLHSFHQHNQEFFSCLNLFHSQTTGETFQEIPEPDLETLKWIVFIMVHSFWKKRDERLILSSLDVNQSLPLSLRVCLLSFPASHSLKWSH